jgi:hypothetical protein
MIGTSFTRMSLRGIQDGYRAGAEDGYGKGYDTGYFITTKSLKVSNDNDNMIICTL